MKTEIRKCDNCLWADKCSCDLACEYYEPAYQEEIDRLTEEDYEKDLKDRVTIYQEIINDMED